jgi:ketosteroid isomerase-like protein
MKKINITSTLLFGILTIIMDSSYAQTNLEAAKADIAASDKVYFQSFAKNDPKIFQDRYAKDCIILAPNLEPFNGQAGALAFFKLAYNRLGLRNGKFINQSVFGNGDGYVTEIGLYQIFDKNNHVFDDGKFLVLWKETDKGWKMFRDSFSSNRPAK